MAAHWEATRESLRSEAAQDPLTGALNRRGIMTALGKALAADGRTGQPTSILLMDLDHFKRINDRFGHAAGDRALLWVTAQMRAVLREGDFLGRYGGDEFLAVLPATDRLQADQVAQRMARVIGEGAAAAADYPSLSIGVACAPAEGSHPEDLIKAADQALYEVKRQRPAAAVAPQDAGERPAVS
jgi:diguanylate cyclase (GGDEF)-like protein